MKDSLKAFIEAKLKRHCEALNLTTKEEMADAMNLMKRLWVEQAISEGI